MDTPHHPPINVLTGEPFRVYAIHESPRRWGRHSAQFYADGKCVGTMRYNDVLQAQYGGAVFELNDAGKALGIKRPSDPNYGFSWLMAIAYAIHCRPIDIQNGTAGAYIPYGKGKEHLARLNFERLGE